MVLLPTHRSIQKIPTKGSMHEQSQSTSRADRIKAVLVQIRCAKLGVKVAAREYRFDTRPRHYFVVPIEVSAVARESHLAIWNQRCFCESLGDDALGNVNLPNNVSVFDR